MGVSPSQDPAESDGYLVRDPEARDKINRQ
jgi:hypothetical protein